MAKSKSKSASRKIKQIVNSDIFRSVAIVSIVFNVLFLASIFVLTGTDAFDRSVYNSVYNHYCQNVDGVRARATELSSEKAAVKEWQITCVSKEFQPYYKEAIEKFNAQYKN